MVSFSNGRISPLVSTISILSVIAPASLWAGQTITITGPISNDVYGNGAQPDGAGPVSGAPNGNAVILQNNSDNINGDVYGGYWSVNSGAEAVSVTDNSVTLNEGYVGYHHSLFGGYAESDDGFATAFGNRVIISTSNSFDGAEGSVTGGHAESNSGDATASNNDVTINGGFVNLMDTGVYGGYASSDTGIAKASNNNVIISGGEVYGDIYGGYAESSSNAMEAANNSVTISGAPNLGWATLYGGVTSGSGASTVSGNALNLRTSNLTVAGLYNFQYLNFYLPTTLANGGTMLVVNNTADIDGATVSVGVDGASSPLAVGDVVTLIDAATLSGISENSTTNGSGMQGVTLQYEFDLEIDNNKLQAVVTKVGAGEQSKALSEGFISGLALITQGTELASGQGMLNALSAIPSGTGLASFGAASGGSVRYNSGSHTDVSSIALAAGLATGFDLEPGRMTLGAFIEYGDGSYDSYNSFSSGTVRGDGDMNYVGGGVLGRMDFTGDQNGHAYVEASLRGGRVENKFNSGDLVSNGVRASYKARSGYVGGHLGLGYVWDIAPRTSLDLSGKYLITHQRGDDVRLSTGETVSFDSVTSQRTRLGARLSHEVNDWISPYVGAAWEYEFDAEADASTNGYAIKAPSLKGGTGIGEIGLTLRPTAELPLSIDLGVQGYAGKREGVSGTFRAVWAF